MSRCLWVIFDGIGNSVFKSQVLEVAVKELTERFKQIKIISFENNLPKAQELLNSFHLPSGLEIQLHARSRLRDFFLGSQTTETLTDEIVSFSPTSIIARGSLAAEKVIKAMRLLAYAQEFQNSKFTNPEFIIQARGLLAEEYWFRARKNFSFLLTWPIHLFQYKRLLKTERFVYSEKTLAKLPLQTKVEVVSGALETHLLKHYGLVPERAFLSTRDLPKTQTRDKVKRWKAEARAKLGIENERVYTFSFSDQPWQCTGDVLKFFAEEKKQHTDAVLLVLAWNPDSFEKFAKKFKLAQNSYIVLRIDDPVEYQKVLCAADVGIIFRQDNILNKVARPVKAMDYFSVGLEIVHNGTVDWIVQREKLRQRAKKAAQIHHEKAIAEQQANL